MMILFALLASFLSVSGGTPLGGWWLKVQWLQ